MIVDWNLAALLAGLGGLTLGWWSFRFWFHRRSRLRLRQTILDYVTGEVPHLQLIDDAGLTSRQDRLAYDLYLQSHRGEASRVYTLIDQLSDVQRTVDMDRLVLKIGLQTNRYGHLTRTLGRMQSLGGVERQVFGSLVCAGRWVEAVDYYEVALLRQKGSLSEWRMLRLCAWVYGGMSAEDVPFDTREMYLLHALETSGQNESHLLTNVRDGLQSGVCYTDELAFTLKSEKKTTKIESSGQGLHLTSVHGVRGDWLSIEYGRFREQIETANMGSLLESDHGLRVREWLRSHRAYDCSHCGQTRRGFSYICSGCLCLDPGLPVQLPLKQPGEVAMPILGVDLVEAECIYWMSLLQAT